MDNTNTQRWEYASYEEAAAAFFAGVGGGGEAWRLRVVEVALPLPSFRGGQQHSKGGGKGQHHSGKGKGGGHHGHHWPPRALQVCAARNSHGVPLDACVRMWERWERDERAFLIPAGGFG